MRGFLYRVITLAVLVSTAACGGGKDGGSSGSSGNSGNSGSSAMMGGALQGTSLALSGKVTTLAGSTEIDGTGAGAGFVSPSAVTTDGTNLYVVDQLSCTIRKVVISTGEVTTLAGSVGNIGGTDGIGKAASFSFPEDITIYGPNLYVADRHNHKIRKIVIATGEVSTLAGSDTIGAADGVGTQASFAFPSGITTDGSSLYVTDSWNGSIRKIVMATGEVTTLAGSGSAGSPVKDGIGTAATFYLPKSIATDGTYLYVSDSPALRKVSIATGEVTTLSADFLANGLTTDGAWIYGTTYSGIRMMQISGGPVTTLTLSGTAASLNAATGITTDGANLYVSDTRNHTVHKIEILTGAVTTIAGSTDPDGTGSGARFFYLGGMTTDGQNLYVTDRWDRTIRKVSISTGAATTLAGSPTKFGGDGTGRLAGFYYPSGITTDGTNLYVADNNVIRRVVIASGEVTTLAGSEEDLFSGQLDGIGKAARFSSLRGITTDGNDLYVKDEGTIRKMDFTTGAVTTLAGVAGTSGSADGTGSAARFSTIGGGLTTDGTYLYLADEVSIRRIEISTGAVTTLAGGARGVSDGIGASAGFIAAQGITCDGTSLYVAEVSRVRKVDISTGAVTTIAGQAYYRGASDGLGAGALFNFPYGITTDGRNLYVADSGNLTIRKIE